MKALALSVFLLLGATAGPLVAQPQPSPTAARATPAPTGPEAQRSELTADRIEMVSTDEETRAVCEGNVVFTSTNLRIACDRLEVIASRETEGDVAIPALERFKYLLASGHVRIVQGDREATCGRAEVFPREERVVLTEEPVLVDHSSDTLVTGDRLVLLRGQRRLEGDNVRFVGPPIRDLGPDAAEKEAAPAPTP